MSRVQRSAGELPGVRPRGQLLLPVPGLPPPALRDPLPQGGAPQVARTSTVALSGLLCTAPQLLAPLMKVGNQIEAKLF